MTGFEPWTSTVWSNPTAKFTHSHCPAIVSSYFAINNFSSIGPKHSFELDLSTYRSPALWIQIRCYCPTYLFATVYKNLSKLLNDKHQNLLNCTTSLVFLTNTHYLSVEYWKGVKGLGGKFLVTETFCHGRKLNSYLWRYEIAILLQLSAR